MPLDQNQIEKVQEHLRTHRLIQECSFCRAAQWGVGDIVASPRFSGGDTDFGEVTVPMVQVICGNCGYVMHFAAKPVGLV